MDPIGIGRQNDFVFYVGRYFKIYFSSFCFNRKNFGGDNDGRSLTDLFHHNGFRQVVGPDDYCATARIHFGIFLYDNDKAVPRLNNIQPIVCLGLNGKCPGIDIGGYTYGTLRLSGFECYLFLLYG